MNISAHRKAALLYLLPILAVGGIWFTLLFRGNASDSSPLGTLSYVLFKSELSRHFLWLAVLPTLCAFLAGAHVSPIIRTRVGPSVLLALGSCLAIAAWLAVAPEIAFFVSLPLVYGFLAARRVTASAQNGA
jgi:hypothetical protein